MHQPDAAAPLPRWTFAALAAAALGVCVAALGTTGLWEPWEMDRADVARTLVESPLVPAAVGSPPDSGPGPGATLEGAAEAAGVRLRLAAPPKAGARGVAAGQKQVQEALDAARSSVVAAVVFDAGLLGAPDSPPAFWARAAERVAEAAEATQGHVILVARPAEGLDEATLRKQLAVGAVRSAWGDLKNTFGLALGDPPAAGSAPMAEVAEAALTSPNARFQVVGPGDSEGLRAALEAAASAAGAVTRFKVDGKTLTVAPLEPWLIAFSYGLFGESEFATRLPFAVLALLALLMLVLLARSVWGDRVALLSGAVLLTTPLFFGQARSAAGEPAAMLGLVLTLGAVVLHGRGAPWRRVLRWAITGTLVLFLGKGLFGLALAASLAGAVALVRGERDVRTWLLALGLGALLALAAAWVLSSPADGFAGMFRFTRKLVAGGPDAYDRNFDLVIRQIGFGAFPWSPLYLVAFAGLLIGATRQRLVDGVAVAMAFAVPVVLTMAFLKDMNHFVWCGAPAGALGVALFLDAEARHELSNRLLAFAVLVAGFLLYRELGKSPEPLAAFLAYDPPFSRGDGLRFPEALEAAGLLAALVASLAFALGAGRAIDYLRWLAGVARDRRVWSVALGVLVAAIPLIWAARVLSAYRVGMKLDTAGQLSDAQRGFVRSFLAFDAASWLALGTLGVVALTVITLAARMDPRSPARWCALVPFTGPLAPVLTPRVARVLRRLAERIVFPLGKLPVRVALVAGGAAWTVAGLVLLFSVAAPTGYWGEALLHVEVLAALVGGAGVAVLVGKAGGGRLSTGLGAAGVVGLLLTMRLSRDAALVSWPALVLVVLGWLAYARVWVPRLWTDGYRAARVGGALVGVSLALVALPLLDRWDAMAPLLYPDAPESLTEYLMTKSRATLGLVVLAVAVAVNAALPKLVDTVLGALRGLQRGRVVAAAAVGGALTFTGLTVFGFYPELAFNVSQKHILDTYREAEGLSPGALGETIFRHGRFGQGSREDVNFYTAALPEIRDRDTALEVLLGQRDTGVSLETVEGTASRVLAGWDAQNDADGDGARDRAGAIVGLATGAGPGSLTDSTASWTADQHKGRVLVDAAGKAFPIVGNDATTLTLEGRAKPAFAANRPDRSHYAIDAPDAAAHGASADAPERRYLLLPAGGFSELNHAFRELSGGRHLPIVDGRSYRVLLATTALRDGEEDMNRFAAHTMTAEAFEALAAEDPKVRRAWCNFDNKIRVLGYRLAEDVVSRGKAFELTMYFESLAAVTQSYKIFLHIDRSGTSNRIHGDHWPLNLTEGGEDDKKCTGCYRTDHWMKGDVVVDVFSKEVPIGTPSGPQDIWMGLYAPGADKRLKVDSWDRERVRHDGNNRVRLGSFQVR